MKLSELIELAKSTLAEHGDIEVCVSATFFGHNNVIVTTYAQAKHDQITGLLLDKRYF